MVSAGGSARRGAHHGLTGPPATVTRRGRRLVQRSPPLSASNLRKASSSEMAADQPYAAATAASRASCASASHCGRAL